MTGLPRQHILTPGFTLVEILVVLTLSALLLLGVSTFSARTTLVTAKGQDNLETVRTAAALLRELRRDLQAGRRVSTRIFDGPDLASHTLDDRAAPEAVDLAGLASSPQIIIQTGEELVRYVFLAESNGILREVNRPAGPGEWTPLPERTQIFGLPRIQSFAATQIWQRQQVSPALQTMEGQVLVHLVCDSADPRFPSRKLVISSFLGIGRPTEGLWNPL